jgi:hypothetical protein
MTEARQTIALITTFRKPNETSRERWTGQVRKRKKPVIVASDRIQAKLLHMRHSGHLDENELRISFSYK